MRLAGGGQGDGVIERHDVSFVHLSDSGEGFFFVAPSSDDPRNLILTLQRHVRYTCFTLE